MKKTVICLRLALGTVCAGACNKGGGPGGDTPEDPDAQYHRIVEDSNEKVWSAGAQVMVLPDARGSLVDEAATEFSRIFKMATGLSVELEYEADVTELDPNNYYYFIGDTDALQEEEIDISYELLGDSGVNIQTRDNVTYMAGATNKGTLYAVYEYMNRAYGYEFYAEGEEYTDDGTDANWKIFDYIYRPSIANPCMMAGELNADSSLYYKYRFQNYYEAWVSDGSEVYYAHTYFKILDPDIYYEDHNNWYSPDKEHKNLCMTRDPAMIGEFVANCKKILEADGGLHKYFMLGQEDNFEFCGCTSCTQRVEELGGFTSAVVLEFTNEVVRRLNEWLEAEYPDREVIFVMFAYNNTKEPPVTWNEAEQKWEPVSDTLYTEKNLSVQYVPNFCDYYAPYSESKSIADHIDGWAALTDILTIWEYSTNFDNYFDCFHNFNSMAENIRLFESYGVDYIVEQSAYSTPTSEFSELRLYLWSKLMWDCTLDTDTLIADFMQHYYKDAAEGVTAYFNAIYGHVDELVETYGITVRSGGNECMNKSYWTYTTLSSIEDCIEEAFTAIEPLKTSDNELYEELYDRIDKQALWVQYWMSYWYEIYIDDIDAYKADWVSRARSHGITMYSEGVYI